MKTGRVYIITAHGGGGHQTFAETVMSIIKKQDHLSVELIDAAEILKEAHVYLLFRYDWVPIFFNYSPKFIVSLVQKLFQNLTVRYLNKDSKNAAKYLAPFWQKKKPGFVISVYPLINKILSESLQAYDASIPFLTIIADYGEMCEGAWYGTANQYYICSTDNLYNMLIQNHVPRSKILKTTGFLLPSTFYYPHYEQKKTYRQQLGLQEDVPTVLIVFGAYGSSDISRIFHRLNRIQSKLQLVFLTGKNHRTPSYLHSQSHHAIVSLPFTTEIEKYLAAADLLIGKPGPNIVTQAISQHLPVIVDRNFFTMMQERYVADFVEKQQLGIVVKNFSHVDDIVLDLLSTNKLRTLQENAAQEKNTAYNETATFMTTIMSQWSSDKHK